MDPESQVRLEGFFRTGGSGRKDAQEELDEEIFGEGGCPEWDFGISCTISWSTRQCHPLFGTHNLNGFSSCGCWSCFSIAFFLGKQEEISRPLRDRLRNPATDGSWKSVSWRGCSEWGHSTGILWSANPPSIDLWGLLSKRAALEIFHLHRDHCSLHGVIKVLPYVTSVLHWLRKAKPTCHEICRAGNLSAGTPVLQAPSFFLLSFAVGEWRLEPRSCNLCKSQRVCRLPVLIR